jgi:hypothetical protein
VGGAYGIAMGWVQVIFCSACAFCFDLKPCFWHQWGMKKETPHNSPSKADEKQAKQDRLAEALRANLRKRKSQARVRKSNTDPSKAES